MENGCRKVGEVPKSGRDVRGSESEKDGGRLFPRQRLLPTPRDRCLPPNFGAGLLVYEEVLEASVLQTEMQMQDKQGLARREKARQFSRRNERRYHSVGWRLGRIVFLSIVSFS